MLGESFTLTEAFPLSSSPFCRDFCFPVYPDVSLNHLSCDPVQPQLRNAPSLPPACTRWALASGFGPDFLFGLHVACLSLPDPCLAPFFASLAPLLLFCLPQLQLTRGLSYKGLSLLRQGSLPHLSFLSLCKTLVSPFGCH